MEDIFTSKNSFDPLKFLKLLKIHLGRHPIFLIEIFLPEGKHRGLIVPPLTRCIKHPSILKGLATLSLKSVEEKRMWKWILCIKDDGRLLSPLSLIVVQPRGRRVTRYRAAFRRCRRGRV